MSSDARIRFQKDGNIRGSHDGGCIGGASGHGVESKYDLVALMAQMEACVGHLAWEIHDSGTDSDKDERYYLAGWTAR